MIWGLRSRSFSYPPLQSCERAFVVGDIHGCADLLDVVHDAIDRESDAADQVEIYLGDYVDRGPDSAGVIAALIDRSERRAMVTLAGNHEDMFRGCLAQTADLGLWLQFGGLQTLVSYGFDPRGRTPDLDAVHDWLNTAIPPEHVTFLDRLGHYLMFDDYFFCHAGIRPGVPLREQHSRDLLWIRDEFLESSDDHGAIVVHGHTPVTQPEFRANRINLDTGAFATRRLTCLQLRADGNHRYLRTESKGTSVDWIPLA